MIEIVEVNNDIINSLVNREDYFDDELMVASVQKIIKNVRKDKDEALKYYSSKFDKVELKEILVDQKTLLKAYNECDETLLESLKKAKKNIEDYHRKQLQNSYFDNTMAGVFLGQVINPIEKVGIYVPGGSAAYPSTVLMNVVPALIAGCKNISIVSPVCDGNDIDSTILACAYLCGIKQVYRVGGAQAIAALTYGSETIEPVDKIFGPGNAYVALAKKMVSSKVGVDMIAGPSEVLIIADDKANPSFVAVDLLAQAEHDENAQCILLCTSVKFADEVVVQLQSQSINLKRRETIDKALINNGLIVVCKSIEQMFEIANKLASEHVEIQLENPFDYLPLIRNAGSIFLGEYAPEALGDYFAGANHTLPTSGSARFSSALSVDDFIKKSSIIYYNKVALDKVKDDITIIADAEGLDAHANAINVRFSHE